jgi:hypothetical protein
MKDEELLEAFRQRACQDSFAELVCRHMGLVFGTARRQLGDAVQAEEICQQEFGAKSWLYPQCRSASGLALPNSSEFERDAPSHRRPPQSAGEIGGYDEC